MKHTVEFYTEIEEDLALEEILIKSVNKALVEINPDFFVNVTITLTDNEEIRQINKEQRDIDKPTDVLSFPMLFWKEPEVLEEELQDSDYDMESGQVFLGDIIISKEKVEAQAVEYGHSFQREILYLTIHGLLHLFGYDHMEDADKKIMRAKEEKILEKL